MPAEAIRGRILCYQIEIYLPAHAARRPGWTRMESVIQAIRELGLEVQGAQRMQVIPIKGSDEVLVVLYDYGSVEAGGRLRGSVRGF